MAPLHTDIIAYMYVCLAGFLDSEAIYI